MATTTLMREGDGLVAPDVTAPTPLTDQIDRVRLDHRFLEATGRVLRVLAPAGFGKTTLVSKWVALDERRVCWVNIARGDEDPVALFGKLRVALAPVVEFPDPVPVPAPSANPFVDAIRAAFAGASELVPFVLVLDDVHRLHGPNTGWMVDVLIELLPASSTLVLVGRRHDDGGSIARQRLDPGVIDVTADELAFDTSEAHRFLASAGVDSRSPDWCRTLDLLAGWPAGLRMVATSVRNGAAPPDAADHQALVEYLRAEWVAGLDPDDLHFLRQVSCLEKFTGDVCDDVVGRSGSALLLQRLSRDHLLVWGLDVRGDWYRLHPLLRRWLSSDLRSAEPQRWTDIHLRAAKYWERSGDIDRAVDHARRADDGALLEEIVVRHGGSFVTRGRRATVERWLESFPPDIVRRSAGLCGLNCVVALQSGDGIRAVQWQRLLSEAVDADEHRSTSPTTWWPDILAGAFDQRPAGELIPKVASARAHLSGGPWAAFGCWIEGGLSYLAGRTDDAREALAAGVFESELTENPITRANCLATVAVIDENAGDHDAAVANIERVIDLLRASGGDSLAATAIALAGATLVHAQEGRRDEALRQLVTTRASMVGFASLAPWFNTIARIPLVRATLLLDDRDTSRALLNEIEHHLRFEYGVIAGESSGGDVVDAVADLRRQVDAMHQPATGASALTEAELRVLRLLPTNLSLADIGSRLFLSRNTVKSHAASIYRKLAAANRSEAVDRAIRAGLLSDRTQR